MFNENIVLDFNVWSFLLLIGACNGMFLTFVFFKRRINKNVSNTIFAGFTMTISYILFVKFLHESKLILLTPNLLATATPFFFLLGPLFYLYIKSLIDEKFIKNRKIIIHFIPFIICIITIVPFYLNTREFKLDYIERAVSGPLNLPYTRAIYYGLALTQSVIYWILCYKLVIRKKNELKDYISRWLLNLNLVYAVFILFFFIVLYLFLFTKFYLKEVRYIGYLTLSIMVHIYGYLLLQESNPIAKVQHPKKYSSSSIDSINILSLKRRLLRILEQEKNYLNSNLKIEDLAVRLNVHPNHLSHVINATFNRNFSEFINEFRVEEAKRMLSSNYYNFYNLEGIAKEAGFHNRISFYRVFKKHTGSTPSQFKTQLQSTN